MSTPLLEKRVRATVALRTREVSRPTVRTIWRGGNMQSSRSLAASIFALYIVMTGLASCGGGSKEQMPPPTPLTPKIVSISPSSVTAGSADLTLTLTGSNFSPNALVNWKVSGGAQTNLAATIASSTTITAVAPSSLLSTAVSASVSVTNPGALTSNSLTVSVNFPIPSISSIIPTSAQAGAAPV